VPVGVDGGVTPGIWLGVGDFNGDCIPDIATSYSTEEAGQLVGHLTVLSGEGDGGFEPPVSLQATEGATGLAALGPVANPRALAAGNQNVGGVIVYGDASEH